MLKFDSDDLDLVSFCAMLKDCQLIKYFYDLRNLALECGLDNYIYFCRQSDIVYYFIKCRHLQKECDDYEDKK